MRQFCLLLIALASLFFLGTRRVPAEESTDQVSYNLDVRPILSNNCFHCHGPDEQQRKAGVRLDVPGDVDLEDLVDRIASDDPDYVMPPPKSNKRLSSTQVQTLRRWVAEGAAYQQHWAFLPPQQAELPAVKDERFSRHPIDRFVMTKLQRRGLEPSPVADKRTLIRRLSFDLTGLPPTPAEVRDFLRDSSPDAYERLVDRLLESPHYGEHQGRYWLDLVRFADTNGLHHDHYREMTPFRDWVIRSFNENLPFDQFVTAQIAGDLYESPSEDQLIASGFNRLHLIIDRGTALPEESFTRNVVDRVSSVGTAFLGLTLECAVCHDHKYDPITQRDFYQLFAFFNNFDGAPETGGRGTLEFERGLQPPYLELPSEQQQARLAELDEKIADLDANVKAATQQAKQQQANSQQSDGSPTGGGSDAEAIAAMQQELDQLRKAREALMLEIPATLIMKEREEIRPAHILVRGNYDQPGDAVQRDTPAFLPPLKSDGVTTDRMDLANWLVDRNHPLTARVAVNRFWQQIFGVGLVKTSEDFGAQGEPPSHPELLDHLALEFIESGWDVKALVRSIVISQTYQQSSTASRDRYLADPENRLLARGSRYRYDAEVIRDSVLSVSGLLNPMLYGKSVKPPQPEGLWQIVAMPFSYPRVFEPDTGDKIYRRSVYSFWKRGMPPPQLTIFDAPTRESCTARRERTNTPLQALVLMNEQQYFLAAMNLADRLCRHRDWNDARRVAAAYQRITSHQPDAATKSRLIAGLQQFRNLYEHDMQSTDDMIRQSERFADALNWEQPRRVDLVATTMLVHSLLNLDRTKTRE